MAIIKTKNKTLHAKPLWDEWIWSTEFTLPNGEHPILYRYYIDGIETTKDKFEEEYKSCSENDYERGRRRIKTKALGRE